MSVSPSTEFSRLNVNMSSYTHIIEKTSVTFNIKVNSDIRCLFSFHINRTGILTINLISMVSV